MEIMFIGFVVICTLSLLKDLYVYYYAKKCKYDCAKCKVWDCPIKYCSRKRGVEK